MDFITIDSYFTTKLGGIDAYIFSMKVKDLLPIYYMAVRGRDNVEGAVQRVLNKRRIGSIKSFILEGNMFLLLVSAFLTVSLNFERGLIKKQIS